MLYKKYREKFPAVIECLERAVCANRLAHAYLLHGDTAEIRKEFAAVLSQIVICPERGADGAPCCRCKTCRQLENGVYPELYSLLPIGKAWQIRVGDSKNPEPNTVRWFEDQFYLTSSSGAGIKVGVIFDCDRMNPQAQNALLKTLEEPPRDSFFILTTGNPAALLPTTRSRCQTLILLENRCRFDFLDSDKLFKAVSELQFNAQNNLVKAEQCADKIICITRTLKDSALKSIETEWSQRLEQAQELDPSIRKRIEQQFDDAVAGEYIRQRKYFISAMHSWFAQIYQLACGVDMRKLANPELFEEIDIPENINQKDARRALDKVEKLLFDLRFNVNEELAIRSFCLNTALQ